MVALAKTSVSLYTKLSVAAALAGVVGLRWVLARRQQQQDEDEKRQGERKNTSSPCPALTDGDGPSVTLGFWNMLADGLSSGEFMSCGGDKVCS